MRKALPCQESREFGGWNIEGQISDPQSWRQSPALWDILSLASLFCACHRDGELQSRTEAPAFGDAPHPEFPADGKWVLSPTSLREHGNDGAPPAFHDKFVHQVLAPPRRRWKKIQQHFRGRSLPSLGLAVPLPGSKGKSPVSSHENKVRKYLVHPYSWFC